MDQENRKLKVPAVAALAVTYRGDELLLVQRSKEPKKYGWGFTREGLLTPVNHCMTLLAESYLKKRKFMVHRKNV